MANKRIKLGSLLVSEKTSTNKGGPYIGLGDVKNKDPKYNYNVELIVTNSTGEVVFKQKNGFINLVDPRTQPDELLALGLISESEAEKRREQVARIPSFIKYTLEGVRKD